MSLRCNFGGFSFVLFGGHQCTKRENYTEENRWIKQSIRNSSQLITVNEKSDKLSWSSIDLLSQIEINFSQLVKYVHLLSMASDVSGLFFAVHMFYMLL